MLFPNRCINSEATISDHHSKPEWTTSSDIFYLLDTVKISYDSPLGKITVENVCLENCAECLASLKHIAKNTDYSNCPFIITVCGVTWDVVERSRKITQRRVRAIPKAAGLRFFGDNRIDSDAYFYQANRLVLDNSPSDYFTDRQVGEAKAVAQLTPEQFIKNLQQNNQQFIKTHGKPLYLHKANFEEPFSEHERNSLAQL